MKFRILFILFNLVIVIAFAIIAFMPLVVLGADYSRAFWAGNWPVAIVFAVVLAGLNTYFGRNWRLFALLEQEDWEALILHLEKRVLERTRVSRQTVRILVNAYVVTGSSSKIGELEQFLRTNAPAWVPRFAPELSVGYLLSNDAPGLEAFSREMTEDYRATEQVWLRWNLAFSLLLQERVPDARDALRALIGEPMSSVQQLLTAYLLDSIAGQNEDSDARSMRESLRARFTPEKWKRELDRHGSNLQVLVLTELIGNAAAWVFDGGKSGE